MNRRLALAAAPLMAGALMAGLILGGALLSGCNREGSGKPKVAFVTNGVATFWMIAAKGVEHAAAEHGVEADFRMPQDPADQKNILEDLLVRGVQGIAVSPCAPDNLVGFLNELAKQVPVITHDSDAPGSDRLCFVGVDNYRAGRMCGELVRDALPSGGSLVFFVGRMEQDNARRRRQGLIDELLARDYDPSRFDPPGRVIEGNGYTILDTLTDQMDGGKAKTNVEDMLSRHGDIDGMVGLFAYNTPAILEALKQSGKTGTIQVIGFDEADATLQGIKDGNVHGTIVQDPYRYGTESIRILAGLLRGDKSVLPEGGFLEVPARKVTKDNVTPFWDDLKAKLGD